MAKVKKLSLARETVRSLRVQTRILTGIKADSGPYASVAGCTSGGPPPPPSANAVGTVCVGVEHNPLTDGCPNGPKRDPANMGM